MAARVETKIEEKSLMARACRGYGAFLRRVSPFRFIRDRKGVAALEFALIGPIHLALLLAMLETGFIMMKIALLDLGVATAAKQIYIGAATSGTVSQADIKNFVCTHVEALQSDCADNLIVELTEVSAFGEVPDTAAVCQEAGAAVDIEPTVSFNPGLGSSVMYMRICLTTDVIFPGIGSGLSMTKTDNGKYEFVSTTAFMNEPF